MTVLWLHLSIERKFHPSKVAAKAVTLSIWQQFGHPWPTWGAIPKDHQELFFPAFQEEFEARLSQARSNVASSFGESELTPLDPAEEHRLRSWCWDSAAGPKRVKPEDMKQEEWNLLDRQALGVIRLTLSKNVAFNIVNEKTTAGLMKALSDMYEKPSAANKVYLMRRLFNLKMGEGISVTNHINEFNTILAQLESVQIKFEDEVTALILLSSLPDSWAAIVIAVSSSTRENTLKLSDIRDLILSEDVRKRDSGESSSHVSNSALNTEGRGRTTQKGQNGRGKSKSRGKGQRKFQSDVTCWNCDKRGHFSNQCKARKKNKSRKNKKHDDDESANAATDELDDALICSLDSPVDSWIMDSDLEKFTLQMENLLTFSEEVISTSRPPVDPYGHCTMSDIFLP
ncbi:Retrovirus-related Pol polyprotein from transposon TNT 1-94 [Glycine soja]|uniref:Retrovirus-related Pol polyprotein from transposon TNT 1-94 n=1 Tax=Glycine soja TaxID=3848 RepID=A0A445KDD6_GLYSO|nr:Retrovirus-related Pol polyprotein from transposon TNT 1-94 [Glycine soja]